MGISRQERGGERLVERQWVINEIRAVFVIYMKRCFKALKMSLGSTVGVEISVRILIQIRAAR